MTSALRSLDDVRAAVVAAAGAAASTLPLPAVVQPPIDDAGAPGLLPPEGDGRAVSLNVRGTASGTLVLVVADSLASALENSPFGGQALLAALGPALTDAGAALQQFSDGPLEVEAAHEVQPGIALAGAADMLFGAVPMHTGGEHVATLALLLERGAPDQAVDSAAEPGPGAGLPRQRTSEEPRTHAFPSLEGYAGDGRRPRSLELLHDVQMGVTAELGRTRMTVRDLLALTPGAVVELDRAAGSPVDVLVNGTLIARGEVVVIDEEFGIRISEIVGTRPTDTPNRG